MLQCVGYSRRITVLILDGIPLKDDYLELVLEALEVNKR